MDFKIELLCSNCRCKHELRPEKFKSRNSLECPNCGQVLPNEIYEDLKIGVTALGRVPSGVWDSDALFQLSVKSYSPACEVFGISQD